MLTSTSDNIMLLLSGSFVLDGSGQWMAVEKRFKRADSLRISKNVFQFKIEKDHETFLSKFKAFYAL